MREIGVLEYGEMLYTGELDELFRLPAVKTGRSSSPSLPCSNASSQYGLHSQRSELGLSGSPSHRGGMSGNNRVLLPGKFVLKKGLEPWSTVERRGEQLSSTDPAGSPSFRRAGTTMWPDKTSTACEAETSTGQWTSPRCGEDPRNEGDLIHFHQHQNQSTSNSPLCPGTPIRHHYSQMAPSSPLQIISSPDVKKCIAPMSEPRSVLDLTISPQQHQLPTIRATLPRRFRETFLEHNVAPVTAPSLSPSPRVLNFESCSNGSTKSGTFADQYGPRDRKSVV